MLSEMNGLMRLRALMAEYILLLFSFICFVHERCSSINKPSDLASSTLLIDLPVDFNIKLIIRKSMYSLT